jgi:signal transduction histidine kinase
MEKNLQDKGLSLVEFLADHSEFGLRFHDLEQLQRMVSTLLGQEDVVYAVITDAEDATLLSQRKDDLSASDAPASSFPVREVERSGYRLLSDEHTKAQVYHFFAPVNASTFRSDDPAISLLSGRSDPGTVQQRIGVAHLGLSLRGMRVAIKRARMKLMLLIILIVLAGIITAILLSMHVTKPLQKLLFATRQIAGGNLAVAIPDEAGDEIGALARSFNKMATTLEQTTVSREHAEQANLAKSEFLANMSHELRTPVHSILSFAELGLEKVENATPEKMADYYREIDENGHILLQLLNSLLDLSKLEAGKMAFNFEESDLNLLVESVTEEFQLLCSEHRLSMRVMPSPGNIRCVVDRDKIRQVVRNILSNAVKYSPDGSEITIAVESERGRARMSVSDCGPGIPENELQNIFEKFVQSSKTKTGAGGTGLGLSISKEIVNKHEGRIWVENQVGGGACFCFEIPARPTLLSDTEADRILNGKQLVQKLL